MSSIPRAKNSKITLLTITPDEWEAYPSIEHSTLHACTLKDLSAKTYLERSNLTDVFLASSFPSSALATENSSGTKGSRVERSVFRGCTILDVIVERSEVIESALKQVKVERSVITNSKLHGASIKDLVRIERSNLKDTEVQGRCGISRSNLKLSFVESAVVSRCNISGSYVSNSKVENCNLTDCDVEGCELNRTNLSGKVCRNGKWDRGNLIGRVDASREVVILDKSDLLAHSSAVSLSGGDEARGLGQKRGVVVDEPGHLGRAIGSDDNERKDKQPMLDRVDSSISALDRYNGPDVEALPAYQP